jgi:hypothetical protein
MLLDRLFVMLDSESLCNRVFEPCVRFTEFNTETIDPLWVSASLQELLRLDNGLVLIALRSFSGREKSSLLLRYCCLLSPINHFLLSFTNVIILISHVSLLP